jgi:very-short-patch-repair endonuclease
MRGPFRGDAAVAAGMITRSQLRGSAWRRLYPCVYVAAGLPVTPSMRIRAAAMWLPTDAVISGRSAAQAWGADLADGDDPVEVTCPRRIRPVSGVAVRRSPVADDEVVNRHGIALTTPLHTAWEIARTLAAIDAIGWIDALARRQRLSVAELQREAARHAGEMGSRRASSTLARADPRAESPPESRLRLAFQEAGFAVPVPQFTVFVGGYFVARVDLAWPQWRLAVEYDGQWHADRHQLHRDRSRLRELNAAGWYVYPVTREDMYDMPRLIAQIGALLDRRRRAIERRSTTSSRQGC